jgi:hypothetical protein
MRSCRPHGADPRASADQLVILYDGAVVTAQLDNAPAAALKAQRMTGSRLKPPVTKPRKSASVNVNVNVNDDS